MVGVNKICYLTTYAYCGVRCLYHCDKDKELNRNVDVLDPEKGTLLGEDDVGERIQIRG